ncbi:cell wall-active antibiotics response protein LiaF [Brevibacillus sp. GCM10020057]|uniref:cell wall-active antibiotics response protein LiaF n=1 Tax=Brevibacillus sp. GCM10020057 TaxID=3317327 RepID=UPI0036352D60
MKLSRVHKMLAGVLIILTGIGLLLDSLHIISFGLFDLWPMALVYFGLRLWGQQKRVGGGILICLGIIIALEIWFGIGFHELFHVAIPALFIYFGFRLIRGKSREREAHPGRVTYVEQAPESKWTDGAARSDDPVFTIRGKALPKDSRSSLIGDFHLTSGRFELGYLHVWHGIGNVVVDLSRAMLVQEEALLSVEGWIGDVTIYVPVDLPVAVLAELSVGDLEVFSNRQGGISRSIMIRSEHYDQAVQKVKLHISLLVGDIKVKYI